MDWRTFTGEYVIDYTFRGGPVKYVILYVIKSGSNMTSKCGSLFLS